MKIEILVSFFHKGFYHLYNIKGIIQKSIAQSPGAMEYTSTEDTPNKCPGYDAKQSDGDVLVMLGSTLSLPLLPGPL